MKYDWHRIEDGGLKEVCPLWVRSSINEVFFSWADVYEVWLVIMNIVYTVAFGPV